MSMKHPHTFLEPLAHTGPDIEIGNLSSKPRDPTGLAHGCPPSLHYCPPPTTVTLYLVDITT